MVQEITFYGGKLLMGKLEIKLKESIKLCQI